MRAGRLRHRVTIQQLTIGSPQQKPTGEPDAQWADVATVWADVRPLQGRALFLAQQVESRVDTEIEIRYRAGINAAMRVTHDGDVYDILAVIDPDKRHIRLVLNCATGVNQG
jgi:SPP1 family predicted phage head-tail adaptor